MHLNNSIETNVEKDLIVDFLLFYYYNKAEVPETVFVMHNDCYSCCAQTGTEVQ